AGRQPAGRVAPAPFRHFPEREDAAGIPYQERQAIHPVAGRQLRGAIVRPSACSWRPVGDRRRRPRSRRLAAVGRAVGGFPFMDGLHRHRIQRLPAPLTVSRMCPPGGIYDGTGVIHPVPARPAPHAAGGGLSMPRPLVVGNGRLLIGFDGDYAMRDLYYPHVGMLNQLCGHKNPIGVWVDGHFSWVGSSGWQCRLEYEEDTLVTSVTLEHEHLGLRLACQDAVHVRRDVYLKRVEVHNLAATAREVRVFFPHDLCIDQTDIGDTALYDPSVDGVLHYKRDKCFLISGLIAEAPVSQQGIFQYATGTKRFAGAEGTWRDAEDGRLEGNPIAQGSVDSVISFRLLLPSGGCQAIHHWIAVGRSFEEVRRLHAEVRQRGVPRLLDETRFFWRAWVNKHDRDWADLNRELVNLIKRSLMISRTQMDNAAASLATH